MHGTPQLLDEFQAAAPPDAHVEIAALPTHLSEFSELASHFEKTLPLTSDSILIAESFSGPLAIILAERSGAAALILCNTFAKAPYFSAFRFLPLALIARIPPPSFLVRYFVIGGRAPNTTVDQVKRVVDSVPADVFAKRARSALKVDVTRELARCRSRILCLHGTRDHTIRKWSLDAIVRAATMPVTVVDIDAPHLLLKTSPREAWGAIEAFLANPIAGGDRMA
jgi:pimeloyl-[acyl-carrier protein] methyl ester esterase